jgi:hypothetical protein
LNCVASITSEAIGDWQALPAAMTCSLSQMCKGRRFVRHILCKIPACGPVDLFIFFGVPVKNGPYPERAEKSASFAGCFYFALPAIDFMSRLKQNQGAKKPGF